MSHLFDTTTPHPSRLLLASQSPRRRRLIGWLGLPFSATSVDTPEDLNSPLAATPPALAISLAAEKAEAVRVSGQAAGMLVLCFDTVVVLDGNVLGKPRDVEDARRMLRGLSGRTHEVVTGVALLPADAAEPHTFSVTTEVQMKSLDDAAMEAWMASGEFMGCAGAYNIEAQVASVTEDECFQNVAGLPLCHLYAALAGEDGLAAAHDADAPTSPVAACDAALGRHCRLGPKVTAGR